MTKLAALLALAAGCIPAETKEEGPTLHIELDPDGSFNTVTDTDNDPNITLESGQTMYSFTVFVPTLSGTKESTAGNKTTYEQPRVTRIEGSITVPGVTIPDSPYELVDDVAPTYDFKRRDPIVLPGSAMGQAMTVKFQAFDENELGSNIVDFNVALR